MHTKNKIGNNNNINYDDSNSNPTLATKDDEKC